MRVLLANPPWFPATGGWGVRAGADVPGVVPEGSPYRPWPDLLAAAAAGLRQAGHLVSLADSIVTRETVASFHARVRELSVEVVAAAVSQASLLDDLPLLEAVGQVRPLILLYAGHASDGAAELLALPNVRAVVCGEWDAGLPEALELTSPAVVQPRPVPDLDALPLAHRDYLIHRYRYPLAGLPSGPQAIVRVGRGTRRRSVANVLDEVAWLRQNYPRLTHLLLADPGLNRDAEHFGALAAALRELRWPWGARLGLDEPLEDAAAATALEVTIDRLPTAAQTARLQALAAEGVAVTLAPAANLEAAAVAALAADVGAVAVAPPLPAAPSGSLARLLQRRQAALALVPPRRKIYVVGQHVPHFMPPWLVAGAEEAGYEGIAVDYFNDPRDVRRLLSSSRDDLVLVDRGHALPPDLIERLPARTVLYYPDVLPIARDDEPLAAAKYQEFAAIAPHFDDVVLHDHHGLSFVLSHGHTNVRGVVMLPHDPRRHRDLHLERDLDVLFVGTPSAHRQAWLTRLAAEGIVIEQPSVWGEEFIRCLNRAKIVLNLHISAAPNTELRIVEALACGCLVVSEPLTPPPMFRDGEHLVTIQPETAADTIRHYLAHPEQREPIVAAGQALVRTEHTARRCVEKILAMLPERP